MNDEAKPPERTIGERLSAAEASTEVLLQMLLELWKKHERLLFGDVNKPGLLVHMDRLMESHRRLKRLFWIFVGSTVSAIVGGLLSILWAKFGG